MSSPRVDPAAPARADSETDSESGEPAASGFGAPPSTSEPAARGARSRGVEALARVTAFLEARWSDLIFWALAAALLWAVAWDAFYVRAVTLSQGSDYWEHSATFRALLDDLWDPKNPHVATDESSPRFGPGFVLVALFSRALGLDALGAMSVAAVLNTSLFVTGVFFFFREYFRDRRASLFGLIVLLGSWYEAWHYSNVYQLKVFFSVASYPSTLTLGVTLLGFAWTVRVLRAERQRPLHLALLALCWAFVFITHPLTAAMSFSGFACLVVFEPGIAWRRRAWVMSTLLAGCVIASVWPYFQPWSVLTGGTRMETQWLEQGVSAGIEEQENAELHLFYRIDGIVKSLWLSLAGIPVLLYLLIRRRHLFLVFGALAVGLPFVVNAYLPLPLGHRFILLTNFYLQAALVYLLLTFTRGFPEAWGFVRRYRVGALAGAALVTGVLAYAAVINVENASSRLVSAAQRIRGNDTPNVRYARRLAEVAGKNAVVLGDDRSSWPVPTFGPKVVGLYHANPLVPDWARRTADTRRFFRTGRSAEREAILARYRVTHVLVKRQQERALRGFLAPRAERHALPTGYVLYALRDKR